MTFEDIKALFILQAGVESRQILPLFPLVEDEDVEDLTAYIDGKEINDCATFFIVGEPGMVIFAIPEDDEDIDQEAVKRDCVANAALLVSRYFVELQLSRTAQQGL